MLFFLGGMYRTSDVVYLEMPDRPSRVLHKHHNLSSRLYSGVLYYFPGGIYRTSGVVYIEMLTRYQQSATATSWVSALFPILFTCLILFSQGNVPYQWRGVLRDAGAVPAEHYGNSMGPGSLPYSIHVSNIVFPGGMYRTSGVVYLEMLQRYQQSAITTVWVPPLFLILFTCLIIFSQGINVPASWCTSRCWRGTSRALQQQHGCRPSSLFYSRV